MRTYVFIIVSLAVFAVGMVVWRPATVGYRAETMLAYRLNDVGDEAGLADIVSGHSKSETQFTVYHVSPSKGQSLAAADQIARRFADAYNGASHSADATSEDATAFGRLAELRQQAAQARNTLDTFLEQHFKALGQNDLNSDNGQMRAEWDYARPTANPAWLDLQQQLSALTQQRQLIIASRTPAHPEVQDVDWSIEQFRERLEHTPRYLSDEHRDGATFDLNEPQNVSRGLAHSLPESGVSPSVTDGDRATTAIAAKTFAKLNETYTKCQQQLADAEQQIGQQASKSAGLARVVEPAHITGQITAGPSASHFAALASLALLAGALAAWPIRESPTTTTLTSVEQVAQLLPLPVVGQLGPAANS